MAEMIEPNDKFYLHVTALRETIRLMVEVDGVVDVNGGWAVK